MDILPDVWFGDLGVPWMWKAYLKHTFLDLLHRSLPQMNVLLIWCPLVWEEEILLLLLLAAIQPGLDLLSFQWQDAQPRTKQIAKGHRKKLLEESEMIKISIWRAQWRQILVTISHKTRCYLEVNFWPSFYRLNRYSHSRKLVKCIATFQRNFTLRCQILRTVLEWFVTAPVNSSIHVLQPKIFV